MTINVTKISTFIQYVENIERIREANSGAMWYRGVTSHKYSLIPTLYRHPKLTDIDELIRLESELITGFKQRSIPYRTRLLEDHLETLFFMQHYGVPTRLLDWTENPFTALFFAVMGAKYVRTNTGRIKFEQEAAVWTLDPISWNQSSLSSTSYTGGVLSTEDSEIGGYDHADASLMKDLPVAVYGAHNSQRIAAQKGVFMVFGKKTMPMEIIHKKESFPNDVLHKLVITKSGLAEMRETIMDYGITDSVVFPDLTGLAMEMKRKAGFDI